MATEADDNGVLYGCCMIGQSNWCCMRTEQRNLCSQGYYVYSTVSLSVNSLCQIALSEAAQRSQPNLQISSMLMAG